MKTKFGKILGLLIITCISCKTQYPIIDSESLIGKYNGNGESRAILELVLTDNNEYKFWTNKYGQSTEFSEGTWKTVDNILILNSKQLNQNDNIMYLISTARWIEFNNSEWKINNNKLTELRNGKWKLKKATE